jgi:hypothetical protein
LQRRSTHYCAQQEVPHARWLAGHTREAVALPLAVDVAVPDGEAPAREPVPLADAVAVAEALALGVQEGCCTHCPAPLQAQQGAHFAPDEHVATHVSDAASQA